MKLLVNAITSTLFFLVLLTIMLLNPAPASAQKSFWGELAWDYAFEGDNATRYGNWYGPGWWGGSELDDRVGGLPPVDALDIVAQKHDFGYELAEKLGKHNPSLEAHYKALADAIAVRDVMRLHPNPRMWVPRAPDPELARRYVKRITEGFGNYWQRMHEVDASIPRVLDITDPAVLDALLDNGDPIDAAEFERMVDKRVAAWNRDYERREAQKKQRVATARPGTPCTCEDWNGDGEFGVVLGKEILRANYGTYQQCLELARGLPRCEAGVKVDEALAPSRPVAMLCTCEDWNRDGDFGVVLGKEILHANYGTYGECMELARGLSRCKGSDEEAGRH